MKYFINGDEVSQDAYDRDFADNINCGIAFDQVTTTDTTTMTYDEEA